jgi:hypothetical protein
MSKLMLPVFVGVFVGAFVLELVRRNNPELGEALEAKARAAAKRLPLPAVFNPAGPSPSANVSTV